MKEKELHSFLFLCFFFFIFWLSINGVKNRMWKTTTKSSLFDICICYLSFWIDNFCNGASVAPLAWHTVCNQELTGHFYCSYVRQQPFVTIVTSRSRRFVVFDRFFFLIRSLLATVDISWNCHEANSRQLTLARKVWTEREMVQKMRSAKRK